jgi:uncharacterized protein
MVIDAMGFARAGRVLEGAVKTAELSRLCQGLPRDQGGQFVWRLEGRVDGQGRAWLQVQAQGDVRVVCQRCLSTFALGLRVSDSLGLVDDAAQLEAMDALEAEGEGPETEYIVADPRLDVQALVEDELILVLPYAPRHEVCPGPAEPPALADGDRASPFAVLERFRKH